MTMPIRVHAICLALNEEVFIDDQLKTLYPFCSGISVLTQYDRDWYGNRIAPDGTITRVLSHPDPDGKISLVVRRWRDETAARNHELIALSSRADRGVVPHGGAVDEIRRFHEPPDYFLIVDADEFYDVDTLGQVIEYVAATRPRAMRMHMHNYTRTWNRRIPKNEAPTCSFAFVRPGVLFQKWRIISLTEFALSGFVVNNQRWQWTRKQRILHALGLPRLISSAYHFSVCPAEIGVVHHAQWVGDSNRIRAKLNKSGNQLHNCAQFIEILENSPTIFIPNEDLPRNVREGRWPEHFFDHSPPAQYE